MGAFTALLIGWGLLGASIANAAALPDRSETPGAVNPAITHANIHETICRPGYAKSVRPPYPVMRSMKGDAMRRAHPQERFADYEFDHLVPLALGGAPLDTATSGSNRGQVRGMPTPRTSSNIRFGSMCAGKGCRWPLHNG